MRLSLHYQTLSKALLKMLNNFMRKPFRGNYKKADNLMTRGGYIF